MGTSGCYCNIVIAVLALPLLLGYKAFKNARFAADSVHVKSSIRRNSTTFPIDVLSAAGVTQQATSTERTTIVVQLINQLGNNLAGIAAGRGLQLWLKEEYSIDTNLMLRHSKLSRKLLDTAIEVHQCFPNLRQFNFSEANSPYYDQRLSQQKELLGYLHDSVLHVTSTDSLEIERSLASLFNVRQWTNITTSNKTNYDYSERAISVPFLLVEVFSMFDGLVDKYYDEFRRLFEFNADACCKLKPDPDESVFHFRNYVTEMPRKWKRLGFEELSPNQTSYQLFGHLVAGDKVAITSRYNTHPTVQLYVDALVSRGIQVRVVTGQTGVEDFCFLMHAQKELVGIAESTYATWAAHLGLAKQVRLYSMDSPSRRNSPVFSERLFFHYNWTNPILRKKEHFELYHADER